MSSTPSISATASVSTPGERRLAVVEPIPLVDLIAENAEYDDAIQAAIRGVLRSGRYVLGPAVERFEQAFADWLGVRFVVGTSSGTDALVLALRSLGVGPGHDVVTGAYTFVATAEAIVRVGARPVFADIEPTTLDLDADSVAAALTPRTRAILPVHLFGRPVDMAAIRSIAEEAGIPVLEDAAQSTGAHVDGRRVGALGRAAAFSFFPTKNLGAIGDGGALVTDDPGVAARARSLRQHGLDADGACAEVGYNARLDALQAAVLLAKLPAVDEANARRRDLAARYTAALRDLEGIALFDDAPGHVYHQYALRVLDGRRDAVAQALQARGVAVRVYYDPPLHQHPAYFSPRLLPHTEAAAREVLVLPFGSRLPHDVQDRVVDALRAALGASWQGPP